MNRTFSTPVRRAAFLPLLALAIWACQSASPSPPTSESSGEVAATTETLAASPSATDTYNIGVAAIPKTAPQPAAGRAANPPEPASAKAPPPFAAQPTDPAAQAKQALEKAQAELQNPKSEIQNPKSEITYRIIPAANGTWGYDILVNGKMKVHQPGIPAKAGNDGFATQEKAATAARFVIHKIGLGIMPPTVSLAELDSLKVLN